ncbi:DUF421 domain-containing protein [Cellulophaga lytica]|uniref:YetF C-terminal domain-containing protein n=2 Tax=Cellulophaga TaxID=104264 RepID=F0RC52_CELLC|nr:MULTISPECIES: YetF domain-containing protein [Cellulophaga]ADY30716.1 protein of unknown function DUF421 [Cellulophaga lytica DSM 7489]AIM61697.1 hypothetical protein IX49_14600 [Cellulophaga lytica]APU11594.1 hypothetical protein A5M85_15280 [Cellulophaga lytica]EWH14730.1 hypothetical protein KLA_02842 [Cellulophaga geojensis KL-A]WQG78358.1 DUF421 domain-containing protein [Cellulophaga lytica]
MENWLFASGEIIGKVILSILAIFTIVIVITRISGLRTFAKMSSFDFASTIAIGSILASIVLNSSQSITKGAIALGGIILFQSVFSYCKRNFEWFNNLFTNKPMLLMDNGEFILNNLRKTNVDAKDVYAKLREANVKDKSEVLAVILESTGDISVLHKSKDVELSKDILTGVKK